VGLDLTSKMIRVVAAVRSALS